MKIADRSKITPAKFHTWIIISAASWTICVIEGILDHALLLITSDHGENLGENSGRPFHHGRSVYQSRIALRRYDSCAFSGRRAGAA